MAGIPILGFPTKRAAKAYYLGLRDRYRGKLGEPITGGDAEAVMELFKRHSDYANLMAKGFKHFTVNTADFGTLAFYIVHGGNHRPMTWSIDNAIDGKYTRQRKPRGQP